MARRVRIPKYCLHKSSGHARVKVNGKEISLGKYNSPESLERYQRIVAELAASSVPPESVHPDGLTVIEVVAAYLQYAEPHYRHSNELVTIKLSLRRLRDLYGLEKAAKFGPRSLKSLRQTLVEDGLSRGGCNRRTRHVVRVFRWAASEELISASVPQALATVEGLRRGYTEAPESKPIEPVSDEHVEATLPHLAPIVADMVRMQRLTGCRPGEACKIRPQDIDRSGDVWVYKPPVHKTSHLGKVRYIFIGPKAQAVLMPYLLRPADSYCFSPKDAEQQRLAELHERRRTPISCGNRPGSNRKKRPAKQPGDHYTRYSYRRAIHRACDAAGIPQWSPNRLRHSAATEIRQKYGLEAAQTVLGHATANVTQVYAARDRETARRVAGELG